MCESFKHYLTNIEGYSNKFTEIANYLYDRDRDRFTDVISRDMEYVPRDDYVPIYDKVTSVFKV